jgi:NTE family protein
MLNFKRNTIQLMLLVPAFMAIGLNDASPVERKPKVCLALSGGGARASSHIGVLKVLDREHIPIDCIVGTSFGALAGGLYSTGYSASEIEKILSSQDWSGIFSDAPQRHLMPIMERRNPRYQLQISFKDWRLDLPPGLWEGQRMTELLNLLTTSRLLDAQNDFDKLPIQFRAVATNLLDGKPYIFKEGRMTEALRASMAIPLVFTPVEKDGMLLVDGGLVANLPTEVARSLGADIIIAADATSPLLEKDQIHTFINVIDQAISLQMKQNVEVSRKLASILLKPDLQKFTATDYLKIPEIIAQGEQEAIRRLGEIKNLVSGIPPVIRNVQPTNAKRIIKSITFEGLTQIKSSQLMKQAQLRVHEGDVMDLPALVGDVGRLYATQFFNNVDYRLDPIEDNSYRLAYLLEESAAKFLGLGIRYDNDYDFVALAELTVRQLFGSPSSATISSQFGGLENHFAALHLTPSSAPSLFIEPKVEIRKQQRQEIRDKELLDAFSVKREGGRVIAGGSLFRLLEVEGGYFRERVSIQGGSGLDMGNVSPSMLAGLAFSLYRDTLDTPELPRRGASTQIAIEKQSPALGSAFDYSKWQANHERYIPISDKSTIAINAGAGFSRGRVPFYDHFYVGGYSFAEQASKQFLGLDRDEIRANQIIALSASYRREIFSDCLGFVNRGYLIGTYNGLMYSTRQDAPYQFDYLHGAGIGLALNTLFGPIRLMGGWAEGGRMHFYISIGPRF